MTKLDWSRSGLQQSDPARVQRVADFVEPDNMIVSVVPLSPAEIAKMNAALIKERKEKAARLAAVKRAKLQAEKRSAELSVQKFANDRDRVDEQIEVRFGEF